MQRNGGLPRANGAGVDFSAGVSFLPAFDEVIAELPNFGLIPIPGARGVTVQVAGVEFVSILLPAAIVGSRSGNGET